MKKRMRRSEGFTLIEVMIVVAIIAILAAIALPSYTAYIDRARRADAKQMLMQAAMFMERRYNETTCYNKATLGACGGMGTDPLPVGLTTVTDGKNIYYNIALEATAGTYILTATRAGNWAKRDVGCGDLSIDQAGVKTISASKVADDIANCWGR